MSDSTSSTLGRIRRTKRAGLGDADIPTVHDVARAAGVSTASVSRALNAPDSVSAELRGRVADAVDALGYVRNGAGRALASLRSGLVGVLMPAIADGLHDRVLAALEAGLRPSGYLLAVAVAAGMDDVLEKARTLLSLGIEGIVSIGCGEAGEIRRLVARRRVPHVEVLGDAAASDGDSIGLDFTRAARTTAQYLHGLGHRRFALLMGRDAAPALWSARRRSLQDALSALPGASLIEVEVHSFESAMAAASGLVRQPSPPTALVCADDLSAVAAVRGCETAGATVPNDVSITGFGDTDWARHVRPPLTTLRLPTSAAGTAAGARLLARLAGRDDRSPEMLARLIVRGTSGPPSLN